jgi:hypothetical protein
MRRCTLRGRENILKRLLIHVGGFCIYRESFLILSFPSTYGWCARRPSSLRLGDLRELTQLSTAVEADNHMYEKLADLSNPFGAQT